MGYRRDNTSGVAKGDQPETIYMVVSGTHYNDRCCFVRSLCGCLVAGCLRRDLRQDYGNAEANDKDTGPGSMESVFWGEGCGSPDDWGPKDGPQVRGDLEDGCWGGEYAEGLSRCVAFSYRCWCGSGNHTAAANWGTNLPINASFVTAMLKGDSGNHWTLKGGDAQKADGLLTLYDGPRPTSAYHPMKKAGAIILGTGGGKLNAC